MITAVVKKIFGSKNDRELKRMRKVVARINALEESLTALDDAALRSKTEEFRQRVAAGETLDQILPEAFAVAREAGRRVLGMRHFDVQMIGGISMHEGKIAEMRTGEGKTLVATLPVYLNAIEGKGVFVVTVNDYLAQRDANWMRPLYEFLGLSVGVVRAGQGSDEKRAAYQSDITYGTNNEFGFDYLRDNMAFAIEDRYQRSLNFAIIDEVDSILIDEARTPLIISGPAQDSSALYRQINKFIPKLEPVPETDEPKVAGSEPEEGHYSVDEKMRQVELTEAGHQVVEELLIKEGLLDEGDSLYSASNLNLLHHVNSALRAHVLFHNNIEYIIQNDQVVLIDEHTGRTMPGRRLSEGLHQAIEAKEGVTIQAESQTLASTTFQNYFRLFDKLAGMTGTADTEAFEFRQIYGLDVVVIPTNKPNARRDHNDLVYLSKEEKYDAIVNDVKAIVETGAPVLVGTASIETSEEMSKRFKQAGMSHKVLNAKYHEQEAEIIAQAGRPGVVTIATNMAGRGTDIVLGGSVDAELEKLDNPSEAMINELREAWKERHEQVIQAGGLHIIGTERHESRRIDNQLRGRAGRQGDPGVSRFYLSLEDNLMRIFASDRVRSIMQALGLEKGEAIEHRMVSNAIEKAQRKVEGRNFDIRKQLLEYDDVANDQRQIIYQQRNELLESEDISEMLAAIRSDVVNDVVSEYIPMQSMVEQWDVDGLERRLENDFEVKLPIAQWLEEDKKLQEEGVRERILDAVTAGYEAKCEKVGPDMRKIERHIMLQVLDTLWKEHLATMDHLRHGIHLRAFAQKNPKQEYKREAFELFQQMLDSLKHEVVRFLAHLQLQQDESAEALERKRREEQARRAMEFQHAEASAMDAESEEDVGEAPEQAVPETFVREGRKVGRNEPCPCGSGKKYKQCHGKLG
ncbi:MULTISPECIES: preprotein translocase subunit SecA [Spongiibacter]|uniref:preprotein translocase subunit SecA n=1 Tax=Spongiibacter TaxID=630749 RepID=UPI000C561808|nr:MULTISPECIES: preprotein translocase subunit SecA [Spongiibacter]MAY38437.1 preprotein translocase subunit SecA [Spongiibacter sp.]MBI59123.1 preprotein translocase subunit SecA [Spongiibacter sp.]|tara:strand:+ start:5885 stop:8632 length:2748 start_codon:yes stop_codon:yes gene_type:complete